MSCKGSCLRRLTPLPIPGERPANVPGLPAQCPIAQPLPWSDCHRLLDYTPTAYSLDVMGKGMRHTVVETPEFRRAAEQAGIGAAELSTIVDHLARHPDAGDLIPGTGGARKVRFRGRGRGKSGGLRVVTAYADADTPVFLLTVFAKGDRIDLNARERRALKDVIARIVQAYKTHGAQRES